ncbi:MAG: sigma-70 family RNA polymerase sigma factor [Flavobacteriales bacterium]|jgi:RNA polymerase sigma-70 factor (TIGR02943 family)|nr:sigma-70 family RNA polymerase sigma factor [Flavobacteriales bacterium]
MSEGNTIGIEQLVKDHTAELVAYAATRVKNRTEAEDLVQDTFIAAFKSFDTYKGDSTPRTWLFSILRHKIMDYYRSYYRSADQFTDTDGFFTEDGDWKQSAEPKEWETEEHLLDNPEFNTTLLDCRHKLSDNLFAVVQMKYYDQLDADAICKELEITPTNYWQLMHRAKLKLRDCVQKKWFNG